jgi:hypothetical protein
VSDAKDGLRIVAAPPSGWCDPDTGTCYIATGDEAATAEASNENVTGAMPDATER